MLILRCTQKLLKKLDVPENQLASDNAVSISPLGNWHAHVIGVSRNHGIIFINDATLFSFVVFDVSKATLKNELPAVFNSALYNVLLSEVFSTDWIKKASEVSSVFKVGRSTSRRVLGSINDLIRHYQFYILRDDGIEKCNMQKTVREMNRIPQKNLGWMKKLANEPFREDALLH